MRGTNLLVMGLGGLINLFLPFVLAIDPDCDYYQDVAVGSLYYINNKNYPGVYGPSTSCRWVAQSAAGTKIVLSCQDINLPATTGCSGDRLAVSTSGNENFADAQNYCGQGTLSVVSDANKLAIGLFSTWNSNGGRFLCSVTAIQDDGTTTPPPNGCDCGWRQQRRIVGGTETGVHEFPAMAALVDSQLGTVYCGASIIAQRYALTAAHCKKDTSIIGLLVGDHDISTGTDTADARIYLLEAFIAHPNWNSENQQNDIAVVRTNENMVFNSNVGPICLPFKFSSQQFEGASVIALGWGLTEFTGPMSDTLQKVSLQVVTNAYCQQQLSDNAIIPYQVCTYGDGKKDPCQGDSGGPIYYFDTASARLYQVGVISYGQACGSDLPGVNTRVTSYLSWIVSVTTDANYCFK